MRLPCSWAQSRLWFLEQWEPGTSLYHVVQSLEVVGRVDVAALQCALDVLVLRHESLRTGFSDEGGEPAQRIVSSARCALSVEDLRGVEASERAAALELRRQAHGAQPFDLGEPPLLRAALWQLGDEEQVLQLVLHHIGSDGWSQGVLNRELAMLYAAALDGRPAPLPTLPLQYADYALWQREALSGEVFGALLGYWRRQLEVLPVLALPTDRARPAQPSWRGSVLGFELDEVLTAGLRGLAREAGGTLYMVLLAAFKVLLARRSRQGDIAVGTPVAGRGQVELEGLIGFFVNTLVLRTQVSGESGFREVLQRVKETALGAYDHAQMPFEKLVEALAPERDPSRNPLFQVMFALQNAPSVALALQGTQCRLQPQQNGVAKFDLTLEIVEKGDVLSGAFEYATDLYDAATVECMAQDYRMLLEAIVADPDRAVGQLPLLTPAAHRQVPAVWNATAVEYPRDATLKSLFEAQVARTPHAVALGCGDLTVTYATLNAQANRIAHVLRTLDVGPDRMVGLYLERSVELVAGILGILKAGGAYVPLDPAYPAARLAYMLEDTAARVVLTQLSLQPMLRDHAGRVICLDGDGSDADARLLAAAPIGNPLPVARPDDLAYVIYTSGSTGRPKGVMISHAAICNHMHWMFDTFGFSEADRIFQKTGICADASVWEFFAPLLSGGRMVLAAEGSQRDPAHLVRQIKAFGVTVMQVVPSLLKALLAEPGFAECRSLRQVFCGGEALDAAVAQTFFAQCSARLHNLYGPTEAAIDATWWTCDPDDRRPIPIGRPIANMQAHVLDEAQQPLPVGAAGELYLGGVGLARGYLGRPDLTAEKFVAHPFSDAPGARLYRTGDRARWREDGSIEFLSRVDHQIKLRGFRIEPGEIEEVLRSLPGIRDAVVTLREDRPGDARLVAHVVTEDGRSDSIDLRAQLERMLPAHMVPSAIVALKALPLTAHGKIDRAALPAPASVAAPHDAVAPRTPEEQALAGIWCDILGLQDVGIRQNFFDLGGHSLLAVQLVNRLRRMFACDVPLRIVFDSPTIERMAADCRSLFEGIVDAAEPELNEGRVLTPEVRRRVLVEWNATAVEYPRHATLASLFEAQVARRPDAVALVYGELTVSYAELNAQANRIAHALRASGVGPDVRVGLYLERSVELVAGVLGILKAGGAYVPLDPSYPPARLAFMLEDTAAPMVLAMQARQPALPAHAIRVLCLDDEAVLARHSPDNPAPVAGADCLAYVIYTSGSTGQPKGVMVEQRSVARLVCGANYASFGADETFLLLAPLAFDASTFELWGALLHGARCVLHPEPVPTAAGLEAVIAQHGVSTLWLTAALFNAVIDERPHALRGLRQLLTGGEALSVAHVRRALAALPGVRLINGYGPTESTTFACCHPIPTDLPASCGSIPIGRPIANTEVFVLDTQRQPVPVGVEGELYIGGAGLARGYLGRAELTAEKFVAHPFSEVPGARLYRTGDRVRWRADGVLEFLGRFDHQVKLRGFRIEPGEIEAALCALPGVAQAAVLLREDRAGERRLVAYVCGQGTDAEALRAQLAQDLPAHMLPSAIVVLDALPLTANGKLDRAALPPPAPEHAGSAMYSDDRLPRDIVERHLLGIWESMFERSDIAVDQDFFAIGGHSLLAVRLVDAIARTFGTRLPLDTFWFRGGTIRDIAAVLRESGGVHWPLRVAIRPGGDRPPLFCLHTIGGNLFHYFDLARALAPGQPVFGLNALGVDGRQAPRCRVGDIAADCIAAMREVQPLGPYRLAGFSSGGMVAFEMAQQLRAAGESVSVLALIDTYAPGVHLRVPGGGLLERVGGRLQPYMNRQRLMHALLNTIGRTPRRGFPDAASAHWWAHWSYRPRHYPGRVDLYVAEESRREASRPCLGWSDVASGLHIHPVAGSHGLMVKQPVVQDLARQLQLRLDEAMPVRDEGGAP